MDSTTIINQYFTQLSLLFKEYLGTPKGKKLPFQKDTHEWLNYFYKSDIYRHVHLEYYKTDKLCVLHSNIFPKPLVDMPIMGFDMIAMGNKITGLFFDFTPTVTYFHSLNNCLRDLQKKYKSPVRKLPPWADFFSNNFYCVTPEQEEIPSILSEIHGYINYYLTLGKTLSDNYTHNVQAQRKYCEGQQKNDKTYKALAAEIGQEDAKLFMEKYLFPTII